MSISDYFSSERYNLFTRKSSIKTGHPALAYECIWVPFVLSFCRPDSSSAITTRRHTRAAPVVVRFDIPTRYKVLTESVGFIQTSTQTHTVSRGKAALCLRTCLLFQWIFVSNLSGTVIQHGLPVFDLFNMAAICILSNNWSLFVWFFWPGM